MELLIIRHGLPVRINDVDDGGTADPELAPEGVAQSEALATWLGEGSVDAIYVSPLRRAVQTAEPLAKVTGLTPEVRDGLAEFDRFSNFYIPLEELRTEGDPRFDQLVADWTGPEREAERAEFRTSVVATIDAIAKDHPGQTVAVVCHGGVINNYLADAIGIPHSLFFEPAYTSINRVQISRQGLKMFKSANEAAHLRELSFD
jgi:probable phosphoglycerate mutase